MPLPTQLLFAFASGVLISLVARAELRAIPGAVAASPSFAAYLCYVGLVLLPGALYFYIFHGDWYLLYLVDTGRIPTALVVLAALLLFALGAAGFLLGAACVRRQREPWAGAVAGVTLLLAVAGAVLVRDRLAVVGSYAQFRGDFGLRPLAGALLYACIAITLLTLLGLGLTAYQLRPGARRT